MSDTGYTKDQIDHTFVKDSEITEKVQDAIGNKKVREDIEDIIRDYLKKSWLKILLVVIATMLSISKIADIIIQISGRGGS